MDSKFTNEKDLMFLYNCSNDNLKLLVDILAYDKNGEARWTEELTTNDDFKKSYPNNIKAILPLVINVLYFSQIKRLYLQNMNKAKPSRGLKLMTYNVIRKNKWSYP